MTGTTAPAALILSGVRTGFGTFGGTLKDHSASDLGEVAARGAMARAGISPEAVDHAVFGNVLQTSADAIYLTRHIALRSGCAISTPAVTVNRLCGSGFEAIVQGAHQILLGESRVVLCGGTESMSQAPHVVRGARWGLRLGASSPLEDLLWEALRDSWCSRSMAETAEALAERHGLTRAEVDDVALSSQQRAAAAWEAGVFTDELVPVPVTNRKTRQTAPWAEDEHRRPDTTAEGLARLAPYFRKDGVVTAGNASGICDGAAALVLASPEFTAAHGLRPIGRLVAWGVTGVDPGIMGIGPVPASRQALQRAGMSLKDMDLVEINEAFAAQYLAVERELGLDRARTNVDGGAIAVGHPLGASGARLTLHLLHALRRSGKRLGLAAACIGGGQGQAVIVEALA
ncbi:MAG: acetyl-CoA C-acetyltransferase [Gemmatimonadota bacterium]|nr:acetyl-CoA C-acetyltransferase [Gemmatimonadota bacterium]MDH4349374.1 acetyl-CoA C-acetyltransferase [Gemmatimonadota bacterium]MDH5282246.1 acetyl-CoA C-acetyltransferase [Gemmatimonadota bacterium]